MNKVFIIWETYITAFSEDDRILRVVANEKDAVECCDECNDSPDVLSGKFSYWYEKCEEQQ